MSAIPLPRERRSGKLAKTSDTNGIIEFLRGLGPFVAQTGGDEAVGPIEVVWFKISKKVTGKNYIYSVRIYPMELPARLSGDLSKDTLGTLPDNDDAEVWDLDGLLGGDDFQPDDIGWGRHINSRSDDGKTIVMTMPGGGSSNLPKGRVQYTYLGCTAQNSPPAYDYIRTHAQS